MPPTPHPANAPGDFYVEDQCCVTCGIPVEKAPDVFAWFGEPEASHCVVAKQPISNEAVGRTLIVMCAAELQCIRYRGADANIIRRIVEMDRADLCDQPIPVDAVR